MDNIVEFIEARLSEDRAYLGRYLLAGSEALVNMIASRVRTYEEILEFHKQWPVLTTTPPKLERMPEDNFEQARFKMTQQMQWMTQDEYVKRFGVHPPTTPILRALARSWNYHPDYNENWSK